MIEYYLAELKELNARNEHEKIYNTTAKIGLARYPIGASRVWTH